MKTEVSYLARMASSLIISQVFTRAWTLADDLEDAETQDRLVELRRQSLVLPLSRQDHVLQEVVALTEQLRRWQAEGGGRHER